MYRLAIDTGISPDIDALCNYEFIIVARAEEGERDEDWLDRAILKDADFIVSPDKDVLTYLLDNELPKSIWLRMPQGKNAKQQAEYIVKKLKIEMTVYE
jgi:predicted nucleic acid-binding protein